jgi:hypothetical protein
MNDDHNQQDQDFRTSGSLDLLLPAGGVLLTTFAGGLFYFSTMQPQEVEVPSSHDAPSVISESGELGRQEQHKIGKGYLVFNVKENAELYDKILDYFEPRRKSQKITGHDVMIADFDYAFDQLNEDANMAIKIIPLNDELVEKLSSAGYKVLSNEVEAMEHRSELIQNHYNKQKQGIDTLMMKLDREQHQNNASHGNATPQNRNNYRAGTNFNLYKNIPMK